MSSLKLGNFVFQERNKRVHVEVKNGTQMVLTSEHNIDLGYLSINEMLELREYLEGVILQSRAKPVKSTT